MGEDTASADQRIRLGYTASTATVDEVRALLDGLPGDAVLFVAVRQNPDGETYETRPICGLHEPAVRPAPEGVVDAEGRTMAVLRADLPTGAYLVTPRT